MLIVFKIIKKSNIIMKKVLKNEQIQKNGFFKPKNENVLEHECTYTNYEIDYCHEKKRL